MSNERVDVLAVMDLHIAAIAAGRGSVPCAAVGFYDESRANFEKARAAVAELIEAAAHMSEWWSIDSSLPQVVALRAAISRIGAAP